jgi:hypothetical protein
MIIPDGTTVIPGGRVESTVVRSRQIDNGIQYLIEFPDETREWFHEKWVKVPLPKMKKYGTMELYEDLDIFETDDWCVIRIDGDKKYEGHHIDATDLLDVLDIQHNYLYVDNPEEFDVVIAEVCGG